MSRCKLILLLGLVCAAWFMPERASSQQNYPPARRSEQTDVYHGVTVADPYRWLEDASSDETKSWVKAQDALLQRQLADVPSRAAIKARLTELLHTDSYTVPVKAGARYFYIKTEAGRARGQGVVLMQDGATAKPRALLDVQKQFSTDTTLTTAAPLTPSPDGRYLAYSLRKRQSRWIGLQILDVEKGTDLLDVLTGQHTVSGGVSWTPDGKGFFYSAFDLPKTGTEQQAVVQNPKIFHHTLGQPQANDRVIATLPHHPNGYFTHTVTPDGNYVIVHAHDNGSTNNRVLYQDLRQAGAQLQPLIAEADAAYTFLGNDSARFWFYTDLNAPRGCIVAIDLARSQREHWVEVVPQQKEAINARDQTGGNALGLRGNRFVLMYVRDGRPLVRVFDTRGRLRHEALVPLGGSIWGGFSGTPGDAEVFYQYFGFADPSTIFRLNVVTGKTTLFQHAALKFDRSRYEVKHVFYPSRDGTRIPMFIVHRKGLKLDGTAPAYMYGYGGMGWISFPWFRPHLPIWLEMGGIYAQPSLRGGGEYGEG